MFFPKYVIHLQSLLTCAKTLAIYIYLRITLFNLHYRHELVTGLLLPHTRKLVSLLMLYNRLRSMGMCAVPITTEGLTSHKEE